MSEDPPSTCIICGRPCWGNYCDGCFPHRHEQAELDRRREAEEEDPREPSSYDINQEAGEMP